MLAVNPVVALWMKQNTVVCTRRSTRHARNAIVYAPACDQGDLDVADGTDPALEHPEKAKSPCPPKRSCHMVAFAFFEGGFIGGIIPTNGAPYPDAAFDGRATGAELSHFFRFIPLLTPPPHEQPDVNSA